MDDNPQKAVRRTAFRIIVLFAVLAFLWLLAFDMVMDAFDLRGVELWGDAVFIATEAAVFYAILIHYIGRHDRFQRAFQAQAAQNEQSRRETHFNTELRAVNAELKRSNAELEQFAYAASHDLRQPLRIIGSYLALTESSLADKLDDETREYMDFARGGVKRMDKLITDLLEYSRIGRNTHPPQAVDLAAMVADVTQDLHDNSGGVDFHIEGSLPVIQANPVEMGQLFRNLIGNAVKYRHPERPPRIVISATRTAKAWEIGVKDNGIGIAEADSARIFGIFQRLHDSSVEGTGIGLAIVKKVVERYGGNIQVHSALGTGSEFIIALPLSLEIAPSLPVVA